MVYYRRYRPQTLAEIIGQSLVKDTLIKSYLDDKLSHAYLFCGSRGTGKTSTARILAKLVNCTGIDRKHY
jgi:DNA polymerase III subunit gamma/tau